MQLELPGTSALVGIRQAFAWLWESPALDCTEATRKMHHDHARHFLAYFAKKFEIESGDVPVEKIRYPVLREYFVDEKRRGRAKETIRKRLSTLKMAMREAVAHDVLERLPEWPVIRTDIRPKDAHWSMTEWEASHLACDDEELRTWIANGWHGGMHSSDLDRFRWSDVDLVARTWVRRNKKSKIEPAVLPLSDRWWEVLKERHDAIQPHPRDLVAGRRMGHPNRALKELCERAGVTRLSPIGLRHSCATHLEEQGADELFQMTWLGLKTPRPIKRHYRHATPTTIARGVAAVNRRA